MASPATPTSSTVTGFDPYKPFKAIRDYHTSARCFNSALPPDYEDSRVDEEPDLFTYKGLSSVSGDLIKARAAKDKLKANSNTSADSAGMLEESFMGMSRAVCRFIASTAVEAAAKKYDRSYCKSCLTDDINARVAFALSRPISSQSLAGSACQVLPIDGKVWALMTPEGIASDPEASSNVQALETELSYLIKPDVPCTNCVEKATSEILVALMYALGRE